VDTGAIFAGIQAIAKLLVAEHLRQFAENLQVQIGGALRYQQHKNHVHRLAVRRIERDRIAGFDFEPFFRDDAVFDDF